MHRYIVLNTRTLTCLFVLQSGSAPIRSKAGHVCPFASGYAGSSQPQMHRSLHLIHRSSRPRHEGRLDHTPVRLATLEAQSGHLIHRYSLIAYRSVREEKVFDFSIINLEEMGIESLTRDQSAGVRRQFAIIVGIVR